MSFQMDSELIVVAAEAVDVDAVVDDSVAVAGSEMLFGVEFAEDLGVLTDGDSAGRLMSVLVSSPVFCFRFSFLLSERRFRLVDSCDSGCS